ncbi:MAG: GNAT family N-acetyltransferase [Thermodesulfobacteriota bacterium]|nr:GNAT family N-acetyltransferase [Thermodesulfobacteriota bacterium]
MKNPSASFFFKKPHQIPLSDLDQIQKLIQEGGAVGTAHIIENLQNAFLIGYAMDQDQVIGTIVLKHPKEHYRKEIEAATGLDLSGFIERGYTSVDPDYRGQNIADMLIKGLTERSKDQKIYTTIRMDNIHALKLTYKNEMVLAATYIYHRTGNKVGVFINHGSQAG